MWVSFPRCAGNDTHHAIVVLLISVCFFSDFPLNLELFPPLGVRVRRQFAPDRPAAIVAFFPRTLSGAHRFICCLNVSVWRRFPRRAENVSQDAMVGILNFRLFLL